VAAREGDQVPRLEPFSGVGEWDAAVATEQPEYGGSGPATEIQLGQGSIGRLTPFTYLCCGEVTEARQQAAGKINAGIGCRLLREGGNNHLRPSLEMTL
jgi:hypothetical protein